MRSGRLFRSFEDIVLSRHNRRQAKLLTMGIDSGSAMTKAVLFDGQEIVDFRMEPSGSTPAGSSIGSMRN